MRKSTKICAALGVVAGLGVAMAPLSVFAVDTPTRTDTLIVTVSSACSIRTGHALTDDYEVTNTYEKTIEPGREEELVLNTSTNATEQTLVIDCNYANGYKIVANVTEPLTGATTGTTIPAGDPWTSGDTGTSYWAAKLTKIGGLTSDLADYGAISAPNQKVAHNENGSHPDGDSFQMSYKVGVSTTQRADVYTGTVAYTLMAGAN